MNFSSVWQGQIVPYLPMLKHTILPALAFATAVVATIMVVVKSRCSARPLEKWTPADDEVDEYLDWREFDAKAQAEQVAREEAERLRCEECNVDYLAEEGHECPPKKSSYTFVPIPIPSVGPIAARAKKQAIYDREYIPRHAVVQKPRAAAPQSDVLSADFRGAFPYYTGSITVYIPSSNDFRVKGITLWPSGVTPAEWNLLVKNSVEIYDPSTDRKRSIPGQLVWKESGVGFVLDPPLLLPRATTLRITFSNQTSKPIDVTAAVHGEHVPIKLEEPSASLYWSIPFFQNFHSFIDGPLGAFKQYGIDCNLSGNGGCLPQAHRFFGYKVSLTADTDMQDEDYIKIYDRGVVRLVFAQTCYASWPCRTIMPPPGQRHLEVSRDMTVQGKPLTLESLECFKFELSCAEPMSKQSGLMFHWWGVLMTPMCG